MKTVLTNTKRFLAMFLALALVILSVPESALAVKAAENSATVTQNAANGEIITFTSGHALDGEVENGDIVRFTVAAADGYEDAAATGVTVTGAESVALTDDGEGTYSFAVSYTGEQKAGGVTYEIATTSSEVISASNQVLGSAEAPVVTITNPGTGLTSVTVYKNSVAAGNVVTSGDAITAEDSLVVVPVFAAGYELDDENSKYTIDSSDTLITALTDGKYTIDKDDITDDIAITIEAKKQTFTFSETASLKNTNATDQAVFEAVSGIEDDNVTYGEAVSFKITRNNADVVVDNVVTTVGGDEVDVESNTVGLVTTYSIAADKITGITAVTYDVHAAATVAYDVEAGARKARTDNTKSYPVALAYGSDINVYFEPITASNYASVTVTAQLADKEDTNIGDPITLSASGKKFTLTAAQIAAVDTEAAAAKVTITATGVEEDLAVTKIIDDDNLIVTGSNTVAYGGPYTLTVAPKPGYVFDDNKITAYQTAYTNLVDGEEYVSANLQLYAVATGEDVEDTGAAHMYPMTLTPASSFEDAASIVITIEDSELTSTGLTEDLSVVIGEITKTGTYDASVIASAKVASVKYAGGDGDVNGSEVSYGKDMEFIVTLAENDEDTYYVFNKLTYTVGGGSPLSPKSATVTKNTKTSGESVTVSVVIDGSTITGNVAITVDASEIEQHTLTLSGATSYKYIVGTGKEQSGDTITLNTKDKVTIKATLPADTVAETFGYTDEDIVAGVANAFSGTPTVKMSGNVVTFVGTFVAEEDVTLTYDPEPVHPLLMNVTDPYNSLAGLQYGYGATADAVADWKDYTGAVSFREDQGFVKFRYKVADSYAATITEGDAIELEAGDFDTENGWEVLKDTKAYDITDSGSQTKMDGISIDVSRTETKAIAVYNDAPSTLTKVAVTVDTGTANEAYFTDYAKEKSTKSGVMKLSENVYTVYSAGGNTEKSSVMTIAVTAAANYKPTVTTSLSTLLESDYTVTQKGQVYTFAIKKTALLDKATITFGSTIDNGGKIWVEAPTASGGHFTVTASVDGVAVAETKSAQIDGDYTGNIYDIGIGKKVVFTITPDAGYTLSPGSLVKTVVSTDKTTNTAVNPAADGFSYTVTSTAGTIQKLRLVATPIIAAGAIGGETGTSKTSTSKLDSGEVQRQITYTYNELEAETDYAPTLTVGGEDVTIAKVELLSGTGANQTKVAEDAASINIPAEYANTSLTVRLTDDADNVYTGFYTVKANKVLTSVKVSGVKTVNGTDVLYQEAGTIGTYGITITPSGATLSNVLAAVYEDNTLTELADVKEMDAEVNEGTKKLSVMMNVPANKAGYVALYKSADGTGAFALTEDTFLTGFWAVTTDSKLKNTTPAVTLKGATDNSLKLSLALPSAVANSFKNRSYIEEFVYEIAYTKKSGTGTLTDSPYYVIATDTKQDAVVKVLNAADGSGNAADFEVQVTVYAVSKITDTSEQDEIAEAIWTNPADHSAGLATTCIEESKTTAAKTMSTLAVRYPTSLSVKAVNTTLYAGEKYSVTKVGTTSLDTDGNLILATITPDAKTTYAPAASFVVEDVPTLDPLLTIDGTPVGIKDDLGATIVDNGNGTFNLVIPAARVDALKAMEMMTASKTCEVRVTAPAASAADQKVSATIKFTVNQRGVNDGGNENVGTKSIYATTATLNQTKKSGTALNVTLPLVYGNTTKAANNAWTWTFDTTSAVVDITSAVDTGTYYGFTAAELNAANAQEGTKKGTGKNVSISQAGKLTLNKDFVFTDRTNKKALVTVKATSKYNPELALTYKVYFTDSTAIQAQGDLVIGVTQYETPYDPTSTAEGIQIIAQKGTAAMTTGEFFGLVDNYRNPAADPQNIFPQLYLLKQGAVISPSGFVDIDYVVTDTALTSTSGNTKIADVWNNRVVLEGAAVGSVTFTAVPENTGVKKTVALSLKAATFQNTATAKDYYSLERVDDDDYTTLGEKANNLTANKYAEKAATLAFTSATVNDNLFTLRVLKGTATLSGKEVMNPAAEAGELDAFYSNSLLKAGTGVSVIWSDQMTGLYRIAMYGKTGKVTVNGVTYTLTNPAKSDVAAGNITQAESAYANVDYAQTVKFAAASKIADVDGVKVELDYTDEKSSAFFTDYIQAVDWTDPDTFHIDTFAVVADEAVNGKHVTSFTMAFEDTMLPQGSYNFYATFMEDDAAITAPQKFTLKVGAAPSVSVKTAYTLSLTGNGGQTFTLTDSKGNAIPHMNITGVYNVLNTSTGVDNNFAGLFATTTGATVTLAADTALLNAPAANCTGFITYSVDGGVTEKTAKVTLSFVSSVEFYLAQLGTAIGDVGDEWSAEYVTNAKALTAIKGLIAMPSNINVSWQSFTPVTYDEDAMTGALGGTLLVKNTKDKNDPSDTLDVDLTIPAVTISGDDTIYGITDLTYTAKDGGSKTITKTAPVAGGDVTFDVPLGTTVSITKMTADPTVSSTPDSYYVASEDADIVLEKKAGPWTLGTIYVDADDLTINTLSTITLTKGANIDKLKVTYKGSDGSDVVKADYTKPVNIQANKEVTVFATPKAGYDAVLTNSKTKAAIAVAGDSSNPGTGAEVKFTATAFNAATTLAATATAHLFNTSVTYGTQADEVYNKIEYNQTWGAKAGWTEVASGATFTAPFGQSVQIRLTKKDGQTVGTKAGDWTVVATQATTGINVGTAVIKGSEAAKLSNYTSKINGTTAITLVAGKNAALSLTNNANPKNAIASMQLSANGGTKAAYTSGSQKVLMEDTVYEFTLNVRKGYEPVVVDSEDSPVAVELASGSTYTGAVYTFGGTMTTDAAAYTVTAVKKTEIGQVNLGTGAPDADTAISAASWVTSGGEDVTLTVGTAQESEALIGDTISLTVVTNPGYDLQIQTQSPTQNATTWTTVKPGTAASAPLKLVTTASDGSKEWLYTVKAADTIARIALNPVAQARSYKVVNGDASKSITNMKVTIDSKSASLSGKSYYGAVLTITFDAPTSYSVTATGASFVSKTTNATTGKSNYKYTATLLTEGETFTFR